MLRVLKVRKDPGGSLVSVAPKVRKVPQAVTALMDWKVRRVLRAIKAPPAPGVPKAHRELKGNRVLRVRAVRVDYRGK